MLTAREIKGYNLFTGLNETELAGVAWLCLRRTYEPNDVIFDPDSVSNEIFLVESENDAIQIEIPIQKEKLVIHTLSKGEAFGWAALGPQHVKLATARCIARVNVIAIKGEDLIKLMDENNHLGYIIMRNLANIISSRLTYTTVAFRYELRKRAKTLSTSTV